MATLSGGELSETKGGGRDGDEQGDDRVRARKKKPSLAILRVMDAQPHWRRPGSPWWCVLVVRSVLRLRPDPDGRPWATDVWGPRAVLPGQPRRAGYWPPRYSAWN